MKKTLCFILTLLTFVTLVFLPDSFAQVDSPEYVVRVIYFLPSDRTPQPDINEKLDKLIKDTQLFYAEQMTAHGFGTKTFRFEADTAGRVVVHRLNGQFNDAYYNSGGNLWEEIRGRFDLSNNIYLVLLDTSTERIGISYLCGIGGGSSLSGIALIPASGSCFSVGLAAHELGHAFGLKHDYRTNGRWAPSAYISNGDIAHRMIRSFCSAEWLDVHRYFEINQILSTDQRIAVDTLDPSLTSPSPSAPSEMTHLCGVGAFDGHEYFKVNETVPGDALPTFDMLGPPSLAAAPNAIRFRFRVTDADGLHQVQLHTTESWFPHIAGGFIACKQVSGTSATVEFVTTELSSRNKEVWLRMIDVHGNFASSEFYPINVTTVLPPDTAVSIPDAQLAAAIREEIGDITTHALLGLITINASNHTGITNLTGLEYAHNLKYLNVFEGEITDLRPLANLTGLIILGLPGHQIRDISALQDLTNLMILSLDSNQISDITALGNLTNLTNLGLGYNDFSDITALGNLTNLKDLFLAGNQISDITALSDLTNLEELFLGNNNLNDITALGNLTNLTKLSLLSNQITDVGPLVSLVNLEELYLAGNPIEDFSPLRTLLDNNPNLQIDIDIPEPPPLAFSPSTIANQTFEVDSTIQALTLPEATGGTAPYTYTLSPIPDGLAFETTTRELNGTPMTLGTTEVTYTATDATDASASLTFTIEVTAGVILDVNGDGKVNVLDLVQVALFYGKRGDNLPEDVNTDGVINVADLVAVANGVDAADDLSLAVEQAFLLALEQVVEIQAIAEAPMRFGDPPRAVLSAGIAYHNVAAALSDAKHLAPSDARKLGKGVETVLEKLLHLLSERGTIPEQTALLPNYPNPFNPETWIPYHLAQAANVTLTIYDLRGVAVRQLMLGHQPAGVYRSKHRAAYWDSRNQHDEKVASGLYFYTFTAGEFTATRKMLIQK